MKSFELYLQNKIGPETFKSLFSLAKVREKPGLLVNNKDVISLVIKKSAKAIPEAYKNFLQDLNKMLSTSKNIQSMLDSDFTFDFLYQCVNSLEVINPNPSEVSLISQELKKEILFKCFIFLLKVQNGIFYILRLSRYRANNDLLLTIYKNYLRTPLQEATFLLSKPTGNTEIKYMKLSDVKHKDFILNIYHLMSYLNTWLVEKGPVVIQQFETDVLSIFHDLLNILMNLGIAHSFTPDLRTSFLQTGSKDLLSKMENNSIVPNGGLFFIIMKLMKKIFKNLTTLENRSRLIKLLMDFTYPWIDSKQKQEDVMIKVNRSEKILKELLENSNLEGYFKIGKEDKEYQKRKIVNLPYTNNL
jgi:hypothetical protein